MLRAYGLTVHPNVLGGFFAVGILLLLGLRPASGLGRALQFGAVGLAVGGLLVTFSRGAWLGLAAGLCVGLVILGVRTLRTDRRHWLAIGGVALLVGAVGGWQLRGEIASRTGLAPTVAATERRSVDERVAQIELGWRVVLERPLLGVGMVAVPVEMRRLDPDFAYAYYPPHLVPLVVTAELGVGGGLAILVLLLAPWVLLARGRARWNRDLAAASGALAAISVAGLFDDYPWMGGPGRTLLWLVIGLWVMAWLRSEEVAGVTHDR
jgi:putative inorganic carbon (HCO3(-)) transporter